MEKLTSIVKWVGIVVSAAFLILFALSFSSLLLAFPVKWLWNYVMPTIFGLTTITYWQAFALFLLSGLLLKGYTTSSPKKDSNAK